MKKNTDTNILEKTNLEILESIEEENYKKIFNNFKTLADSDDSVNTIGMWKLKKKLFPSQKSNTPMAMKDESNNKVTNVESLKILYQNEFKERLRRRPIHPDMKSLEILQDK